MTPAPGATTDPVRASVGRPQGRLHLPGRHDNTYVVTTALPSGGADRDLRQKRYVLSQAVRLLCFLAAALLPLPMPARFALVAASIALPWGAVVAANAGPARTRRRVHVLPSPEPQEADDPSPPADCATRAASGAGTAHRPGSSWYRLRWRVSYALLQAYGPAELSGDCDPRQRMVTERADHDNRVVAARPRSLSGAPAQPRSPASTATEQRLAGPGADHGGVAASEPADLTLDTALPARCSTPFSQEEVS